MTNLVKFLKILYLILQNNKDLVYERVFICPNPKSINEYIHLFLYDVT